MRVHQEYSPYFDQEVPREEITGLIAELDRSNEFRRLAVAVFTTNNGYLIVLVGGLTESWPECGWTRQWLCDSIIEVRQQLNDNYYLELLAECEAVNWEPRKVYNGSYALTPVTV